MEQSDYIDADENNLKLELLDWQKRGLMETATGYGSKLTSYYKIKYKNRWYRIYYHSFSNVGISYIISKGKEYIIRFN